MAAQRISVFIEHVRSFAEAQEIPLRPLTLLVGENSSGKSTFLAMAAAVFDRERFPGRPGFNDPPFSLGTFETIATFKGGNYGRDTSFAIGYTAPSVGPEPTQSVKATYVRDRGKAALKRFEGQSSLGSFQLDIENEQVHGTITLGAADRTNAGVYEVGNLGNAYLTALQRPTSDILQTLIWTAVQSKNNPGKQIPINQSLHFSYSFGTPFLNSYSLSPIRTKPKRTYDDLSEDYSPEGDHIPRLLARLFNEEPTDELTKKVRSAIVRFGKESGLFKDIEVKRLGKGADDPFQVQFALGGPRVNLVDVGCGVSQALPVVVQSVIQRQKSLLLIQQPEVHLHPRAQAALGTFFAELVAAGQDTILIETHSDYLVDRVRQEVARGTIPADDVMILFFDRHRTDTTVHPITLDRLGNVIGAPEHYREFFLKEVENLFSGSA
jgi:energy-coupling factor transporter ATP-binding protein EcfA2